jgi:hypothetical protein
MNIHLNFMDNLNWLPSQAQDYFAIFANHVVTNLQKATPYLKSNQYTEGASLLAVNLGVIYLADRLTQAASERFKLEDNPSIWVESGKWGFKAILLYGGAVAFNCVMNMQLSRLYLVSSVIASLALQVFWQKVLGPAMEDCKECNEDQPEETIEEQASTPPVSQQEPVEEEEEVVEAEEDEVEVDETEEPEPPEVEPKEVPAAEEPEPEVESEEVAPHMRGSTPTYLESKLVDERKKGLESMFRRKAKQT